jgi:hypothetical protein
MSHSKLVGEFLDELPPGFAALVGTNSDGSVGVDDLRAWVRLHADRYPPPPNLSKKVQYAIFYLKTTRYRDPNLAAFWDEVWGPAAIPVRLGPPASGKQLLHSAPSKDDDSSEETDAEEEETTDEEHDSQDNEHDNSVDSSDDGGGKLPAQQQTLFTDSTGFEDEHEVGSVDSLVFDPRRGVTLSTHDDDGVEHGDGGGKRPAVNRVQLPNKRPCLTITTVPRVASVAAGPIGCQDDGDEGGGGNKPRATKQVGSKKRAPSSYPPQGTGAYVSRKKAPSNHSRRNVPVPPVAAAAVREDDDASEKSNSSTGIREDDISERSDSSMINAEDMTNRRQKIEQGLFVVSHVCL